MASIKELKKDINYLAYDRLTETFAYKHFHPDMDEKKFDEIILNLVRLRNELVSRVNNPDSGADMKTHFRKIRSEMVDMVKLVTELSK